MWVLVDVAEGWGDSALHELWFVNWEEKQLPLFLNSEIFKFFLIRAIRKETSTIFPNPTHASRPRSLPFASSATPCIY